MKTQAQFMAAKFVEYFFMYFKYSHPLHNLSHLVKRSQVTNSYLFKHKLELFKYQVCEKYFKTKYYLVSHGTTIYNQ